MNSRWRLSAWAGAALVAALPAGCGGAHASDADVAALKTAMAARLAAMPDVAHHKWNAGTAVEDPVQEAAVLEAAIGAGRQAGLRAETVRQAMLAQIDAAKQVQSAVTNGLLSSGAGPLEDVPDLGTVLRPQIAAATASFIEALAAALADLKRCDAASALRFRPETLATYAEAWSTAAEGVIAAAGGPDRASCPPLDNPATR